jgi:succinoglycan biosynthesis transport protein ExoP
LASYIKRGFDPDFRRRQSDDADDEVQGIKEILSTFRRRKVFIAVITAVLFAAIAGYVFTCTPLFTSRLYMLFEWQPAKVIDFKAELLGSMQAEAALLGEIEVLKSRKLAVRVIKDLALDTEPEFNPKLREWAWFGWLRVWAESYLSGFYGLETAMSEAERRELEEQQVVDEFLDHLKVGETGRSRVVEVSFTSESPGRASQVANTLAEKYLQMQFERTFEITQRASTWLTERIEEMRDKSEETEKAMASYRKAHGLLQGQQNEPLINEEISNLNARLTEASMDRIKAEATLAQVLRDVNARNVDSISKVLDSTLVQRLREQETELTRREAEFREEFGARHPRMIQLQAEKQRFKEAVETEVKKLLRNLDSEVIVARKREKALSDKLSQVKADLATANQAYAGLNSLERIAESNNLLLDKFLTGRLELAAQQTAVAQSAVAYVMSPAVIPTRPSFPLKGAMLGGGLIVSLIAASLLAFLIDHIDSTFRSAPQVEDVTGLPVLSLIPEVSNDSRTRPIIGEVIRQPMSRFSEAIRGVYTRLVLVGPASRLPTCLLFLSANPGEGKSTVALSTARLIAVQSEKRVILVDADLRRSDVAGRMRLEEGPGLAGALAGDYAYSDAVQRDPLSPMDVLLSGRTTHKMTSLPYDKLQVLLDVMKKQYDVIVIDSPPLFALADPHILTAIADATVLVVQWGKTPRKVVTYALELLTHSSAKIAGVVLSKVRLQRLAGYGQGDAGYYFSRKYYTT